MGEGRPGGSPDVAFHHLLSDHPRFHRYGRRRGHRLRPSRRRLMETLLPRLHVEPSDDGALLDPARLFGRTPNRIWLEIGFGAGEHLAAQAEAHPEVDFIGCEPFVNGVAALLSQIDAIGQTNVRIHDDDARLLLAALPEAAVERTFILFPDPWPKTRHHKRRIIAPPTLDALARVMADGAELRFASDHMDYVRWTLDHICRHGAFAWTARRPADWRQRPADAVETRYEAKARADRSACVHLIFRRRHR